MKTLAFFNSQGRMGKTSLVYHLSWMFAEMGVDVVAIDLDPQSNLTSSFLEDEQLIELWDAGPSRRTLSSLPPGNKAARGRHLTVIPPDRGPSR